MSDEVRFCDITMSLAQYDDELALRAYVGKHCRHLMTPLERRVIEYNVPIVSDSDHEKVSRVYQFLERRDGHVRDEDVRAAFFESLFDRRNRAVQRLLDECADQLHVNRCPACQRVTRTPIARQCVWCRHDWH